MRRNVLDFHITNGLEDKGPGKSEQQRECPECGKVLTLRGLYGHLRIQHGKRGKAAVQLAEAAQVTNPEEAEEVKGLLSAYREWAFVFFNLERMHELGCFDSEETYTFLRSTINKHALGLDKELKARGITYTQECIDLLKNELGFRTKREATRNAHNAPRN